MSQHTLEERRAKDRLRARVDRARHLEARRAYQREWRRQYRAAHPEQARAKARKYASNPTPEQRARKRAYQLVYERAYRAAKPEKGRAKHQRYYQAHRQQILAKQRDSRAGSREAITAAVRARRLLYGDVLRAQERTRYARMPPDVRQRKIYAKNQAYKTYMACRRLRDPAWYARIMERRALRDGRRRARLAAAPVNDLTAADWQAIKAIYGYRCVYCGKKVPRLTMDHLTPLFKGGSHTKSNVVPACTPCNSRKHVGPVLKPVQPLLL